MFLKIMDQLINWSQLRGIPRVSAWVGSHRWTRITAWWVIPCIFWAMTIIYLQQAGLALTYLGVQLAHDPSNSMWLWLIVPLFLITFIALSVILVLLAPTLLYTFVFETSRLQTEREAASSRS